MKRRDFLITLLFIVPYFFVASPSFAAVPAEVTQIQDFIQSVIQVLVTIATLVAAIFFVFGGFGYITSSGNPENLDRSKKTIVYSAFGLAIAIGAMVFSNIVTSLAQSAFAK